MELLGDKFAEFFDVSSVFKTKADFDEKVYNKVKDSKLAEVRTLVKQNKPSIR